MRGRRLLVACLVTAAAVWLAAPTAAVAQGWYGYGPGTRYLGYGPPPAAYGGTPWGYQGFLGIIYRPGMYAGLFTGPIPVDGPDGRYHPGYYRGFRGYYQPPWAYVPGVTGVYNRPEYRAIAAGYGPIYSPPMYRGYTDQPELEVEDGRAAIRVRLPADADLWFEGRKTAQTGAARRFVTPALRPGEDYTYDIRARWTEEGREVTRTHRLQVRAGQQLTVDLLEADRPTGNAVVQDR